MNPGKSLYCVTFLAISLSSYRVGWKVTITAIDRLAPAKLSVMRQCSDMILIFLGSNMENSKSFRLPDNFGKLIGDLVGRCVSIFKHKTIYL